MTKEWLKENLSFFEYSNVFEILDRGFEATAGCGLFFKKIENTTHDKSNGNTGM